jgi:hypothetical protein
VRVAQVRVAWVQASQVQALWCSASRLTAVELDPEDAKLVTLARSVRARIGAVEGAAVRDEMGRTYAAASVSLPSLTLTALQAAVAVAVSSGAQQFEAAAVVGDVDTPTEDDLAVLSDIGSPPLVRAQPDGTVRR